MSEPSPPPSPDPESWTLHCPACRRSATHTLADLLDVMLRGWPTCCGAEMVLAPGRPNPGAVPD